MFKILRERATVVAPPTIPSIGLTATEHNDIVEQATKYERNRAEQEFDAQWTQAQRSFEDLKNDEVVQRLKRARNKLIAHTDTILEKGKYRTRSPADFDLRWGDAEHVTRAAIQVLKDVMGALFGIGIAADQTAKVFANYAEDFWKHLRTGLASHGGGSDKPVRPRT